MEFLDSKFRMAKLDFKLEDVQGSSKPIATKEICNRAVTYQHSLARKSEELTLSYCFKTEMGSVNKYFFFGT